MRSRIAFVGLLLILFSNLFLKLIFLLMTPVGFRELEVQLLMNGSNGARLSIMVRRIDSRRFQYGCTVSASILRFTLLRAFNNLIFE